MRLKKPKTKIVASECRDPIRLTDHPLHQKIYGDYVSQDLIDSVKADGILTPILITDEGVVISGRCRRLAAVAAQLDHVPCSVLDRKYSAAEIEQLLIASNIQRVKTASQVAFEADALLEIQKAINKERQANGEKTERARDTVGEIMGISGRSVANYAGAARKIHETEAAGNFEAGVRLRETLDKSGPKAAMALGTK